MSTLTPTLSFKVKGLEWHIQSQTEFELKLRAVHDGLEGWFRVVITAKNAAATTFLQTKSAFAIHQNQSSLQAHLLPDGPTKTGLVFLRHQPLKTLTLHWHAPTEIGDAPEFTISVSKVSTASAWFHMLTYVSKRHAEQGGSKSYIYRISRARTKRAGVDVALEKLIKEYQPQLSHQLISCEPYTYWQQHKEPELKTLTANVQPYPLVPFTIIIKAKKSSLHLLQTLQSIQQQHHSNWQVFICQMPADPSNELKHCIAKDARINQTDDIHIDAKRWYLFVDAGDLLAADCLSIFANKLSESPAALLYSDHDGLNTKLERIEPAFKPQWNPDLLMHQNYIGGAFTVKGNLLSHLQQQPQWALFNHYVLLLEAISQIKPQERAQSIHRIARVLFHQAKSNQKLGYSLGTVKQIKTLLQKLAQMNGEQILKIDKAKADHIFHLRYVIPSPQPMVSLIIPTRDSLEITRTCVNSILHLTYYPNYEVIIVDNQSEQPETLAWFKQISKLDKVRVISYDKPFNYSAINNFAVAHAKGSVIGLINNDTEVINKSWLTEMLQHVCRPDIGCVGAKLYFHDDTVQHGGVILGLWGLAGHSHKNYLRYEPGHQSRLLSVQNLSAVTAACLLIRKSVFEQVGGLEEEHLTVAFNDVDLCLKVLEAGYRNLWTPYAELYHYESKSRGKEDTPEKKAREQSEIRFMQQKWPTILADDPNYNPNLTHASEDFTIAIV